MDMHLTPADLPYRDRKKWVWLASLAVPATVGAGPLLYLQFHAAWMLWLPLLVMYGVVPMLDWLLGEDRSNPPESAVPALEQVAYYRYITFALVPILGAAWAFSLWFLGTQTLPLHGVIAVIIIAGGIGGFAINLAHEMGHKRPAHERGLAQLVLAPFAYGHFVIEHNRGHHKHVSTPEDSASSRMGESIYRFALRELPGGLMRGWKLEWARCRQAGLAPLSLHNELIITSLITLALWTGMIVWLGTAILPMLLGIAVWAWFQLTSANYIEHYGLLRRKQDNGQYERCQPHHSWNSNHIFSNWALFHLQRHSDHHAHPMRRYQSLRHFDNLPTLPNGYFGMFVIAYLPPLWFHVMNPRLIKAVGGDASRIHFQPGKEAGLRVRYRLA
ncbi:alkane 1-monooxygenase [Burkholderiaceae bacterium DAT-1]|nr:alkane 1-monooxygenase [Burkholderiaceae bacterium DAT-1]